MKVFLTLFLTITLSIITLAQPGNRPQGNRSFDMPEITIKGIILDENNGAPLEFATIAFYSKKDSSLRGGGISDVNGNFEVKSKPGIDIGTIQLGNEGINLEEVEVVAEKSETTFSLDKKVFTVGKDLANKGGTAEEILDNVPSVTVDIEGEVSLRGSSGVRILVDGRPSTLGENLKSIPASTIQSVEVITNPSARYEAEGQAGIVNIVLKKSRGSGFNGSFDVITGLPWQAGLGANVNYRKGKVNWFANYAINYRESMGGGLAETIFFDSIPQSNRIDSTFSNSVTERNRSAFTNSIRLGGEYFFTDKESLTAAFRYKFSDDGSINTVFYEDFKDKISPETLFNTTKRTEDEKEDETGLEYSLNYRKQFGNNRKHALSVTASYEDDLEKEYSDFNETNTNIEPFKQRSTIDEGSKTWLLQTDYVKPIAKDNQYELGLRGSFRNIRNNFTVDDDLNGEWVENENFTNNFNYDELILAGYGQYGNRFGAFSFQVGLRIEHTQIETELGQTILPDNEPYTDFFPSAFLNYEIDETNAIQVNYSRRISRPRFFTLNPFITYADRRGRFVGNPGLTPEYTDSYELNYLRFWEKATLSAGVFYRHSIDANRRIRYRGGGLTTVLKPYNLSTRDDMGFETNLSYSGLKWLRLDANVSLFNLTSPLDSIFVDEIEQFIVLDAVDDFSWTSRITSKITFWKGTDLQLRFNYRGARETPQGEGKSVYTLDLGCSKDLLKSKNLTATLSIRDLLNSRQRRGTTITDNYISYNEFRWRGRTGTLTFNYRINQKKRFDRGRGGAPGGDFDGGF